MKKSSTHLAIALILLSFTAINCAGYAGDVQGIRSSLISDNKVQALQKTNQTLDVDEESFYPEKMNGDKGLLLLERASIKQSMGMYHSSTLDYRVADKYLELLDIKNDTLGSIGKWLFSGDSGVYKAPPHEKLLLNIFNMLNYLAMGNLEEARVESRRLDIMQRYLSGKGSSFDSALGLGNYLAGFTYEMSGRNEQAFRQYGIALASGDYQSLKKPLNRLAGCTKYRTDRLSSYLEDSDDPAIAKPCLGKPTDKATILVVSSVGLAPYKIAKRFPIGAAVVIAGDMLSPANTREANNFAAKGFLKWVMFSDQKQTKPNYNKVKVAVDGKPVVSDYGENITALVKNEWNNVKGKIMASAIVRMIARAVAGSAANKAVGSGSSSSGWGLLAQIIVEGTMAATDTPDTRSWVTLPSFMFITRIEVPSGTHKVSVSFEGYAENKQIDFEINAVDGGFTVVPLAMMR